MATPNPVDRANRAARPSYRFSTPPSTCLLYTSYEATKDQEFMNQYGYEMAFEAAQFWRPVLDGMKRRRSLEFMM